MLINYQNKMKSAKAILKMNLSKFNGLMKMRNSKQLHDFGEKSCIRKPNKINKVMLMHLYQKINNKIKLLNLY